MALDVLALQGLVLEYCQSPREGQRKLMLCHHFGGKDNKSCDLSACQADTRFSYTEGLTASPLLTTQQHLNTGPKGELGLPSTPYRQHYQLQEKTFNLINTSSLMAADPKWSRESPSQTSIWRLCSARYRRNQRCSPGLRKAGSTMYFSCKPGGSARHHTITDMALGLVGSLTQLATVYSFKRWMFRMFFMMCKPAEVCY